MNCTGGNVPTASPCSWLFAPLQPLPLEPSHFQITVHRSLSFLVPPAPASYKYGYRNDAAAVPGRVGRSPQHHPVAHDLARIRSEQIGNDGRDRRNIVAGGGIGGGYPRHDSRGDGLPDGGKLQEDELGFMAPCWRLLEMAKHYLDQVGTFGLVSDSLSLTLACRVVFALCLIEQRKPRLSFVAVPVVLFRRSLLAALKIPVQIVACKESAVST